MNKRNQDPTESKRSVPPIFISALDLLQSENFSHRFLVEDLIPADTIAVLSGPSDLGKSILARQLAISVSLGKTSFAGFKLNTRYNRAIYLSTEDGSIDWKKKLHEYDFNEDERLLLNNLKISINYEQINYNILEKILQSEPADLMVIDVFADTFSDDLNSAIAVRKYFKGFKQLAETYHCTFLFVHHINKQGEKGNPSKLNILGSGAIEQAVRCVLELRADPVDSDSRCLYITKSNYIPVSEKKKPYKLKLLPNLTFEYTGERVMVSPASIFTDEQMLISKILERHGQGLSLREISEKLSADGIKIGKTKVGEILKKHLPGQAEHGDNLSIVK